MSIKRWAARTDDNKREIVAIFRSCGWSVHDLRQPVDLLCGRNGITLLVEIKRNAKSKLTDLQKEFIDTWKGGPVVRVMDSDGAMQAASKNWQQSIKGK